MKVDDPSGFKEVKDRKCRIWDAAQRNSLMKKRLKQYGALLEREPKRKPDLEKLAASMKIAMDTGVRLNQGLKKHLLG